MKKEEKEKEKEKEGDQEKDKEEDKDKEKEKEQTSDPPRGLNPQAPAFVPKMWAVRMCGEQWD